MLYWLSRTGVEAEQAPGDTVGVVALFNDAGGCEKFVQRVLVFGPGASHERIEVADDEVLYALAGEGTLVVGASRVPMRAGVGVFVRCGAAWSVETGGTLELLSVLVRDPEPSPRPAHAVVDLAGEDRRSATASRKFTLGLTPAAGCPSVTQFIGYVPPGRAPDHFHRYDEVIYVLEGEGILRIGGEDAPLGPGACIHLPATLVHCLENTGDRELRLLGVFRPAGSPAEAYYPDGSPAAYPEEP